MKKKQSETALYADLNMIEIDSDIESTLAKLRWIKMENEDEFDEAAGERVRRKYQTCYGFSK